MGTEMTKGTEPTNFETSNNGGLTFKDRRSTQLKSGDYDSIDASPLKVDGRSTLVMNQLLNDRRGS